MAGHFFALSSFELNSPTHPIVSFGYKRFSCQTEGMSAMRLEHDLLGDFEVPSHAYWGVHTARAAENFPISGVPIGHYRSLIRALALVKQAAAEANCSVGELEPSIRDAVVAACGEVAEGKFDSQFIVDAIQGGAGTSTNMNANEVIANRALEIAGFTKGEYDKIHPLNHVNASQSTNDVYPTAIKVSLIIESLALMKQVEYLRKSIDAKALEFKDVIKMGRTQLQDAVPMTLGQEFAAFARMTMEDEQRLRELIPLLCEVNLGGTAIGTQLNAPIGYVTAVTERLSELTKIEFESAADMVEATQDAGVFVLVSGVLKRVAVKLSKTSNDLRLLSSGPRAGFGEINLPPMQAGSSIMPGKVNPVIPEAVAMVCAQVMGNHATVSIAGQSGSFQLNTMMPVIAYNSIQNLNLLASACSHLAEKAIDGLKFNKARMSEALARNPMLVTALNPVIGYEKAAQIAKRAYAEKRPLIDVAREMTDLSLADLKRLLDPARLTA